MLWLVQRLFYGPESTIAASTQAGDLRFGEAAVLWPLAILMLVMGISPNYWLEKIENRNQAGISRWVTSAPSVTPVQSHLEAHR